MFSLISHLLPSSAIHSTSSATTTNNDRYQELLKLDQNVLGTQEEAGELLFELFKDDGPSLTTCADYLEKKLISISKNHETWQWKEDGEVEPIRIIADKMSQMSIKIGEENIHDWLERRDAIGQSELLEIKAALERYTTVKGLMLNAWSFIQDSIQENFQQFKNEIVLRLLDLSTSI